MKNRIAIALTLIMCFGSAALAASGNDTKREDRRNDRRMEKRDDKGADRNAERRDDRGQDANKGVLEDLLEHVRNLLHP